MFEPSLAAYCQPTNDFLLRFSAIFHTCIPTPLAFLSNTFGIVSIVAWLFSQLPQIYKNWSLSSTSGLSFFFLLEWTLGDLSNLLGAIFTHQEPWQIAIGIYYVFVDLCLVSQWLWYEKLRHGRKSRLVSWTGRRQSDDWPGEGMRELVMEGIYPVPSCNRSPIEQHQAAFKTSNGGPSELIRPQIIFRAPNVAHEEEGEDDKPPASFSATPHITTIQRVEPSSPMASPFRTTILLVACLATGVRASPMTKPLQLPVAHIPSSASPLERAGTILSWMSTVLYLGSRLPQLIKNWQRESTAGLSPQLFVAAFCGNLFYSLALLTNPRAWFDFEPYGGGGWVGPEGSERVKWIPTALPFFLGAAGVLGLDACVGFQFMLYGESEDDDMVGEEQKARRLSWRRVRGWMRGWILGIGDGKSDEREVLLEGNNRRGEGYGTL